MFDFNADDTANFIYLSVLLAVLASSILFKKQLKTSEILRQLFWWFVIILTIILVYSFRHNLVQVKNRLMVELFPSHANRISNQQIAVNISADRHFYINLKINGKMIKLMVDTGASNIVLNRNDAKKIGFDPKSLTYNQIYQTANGQTYGASVVLNQIELDDLIFYDVPASVNDSDMGTSLLGMRFLQNNFSKYEFYQDRLILTH